MEDQELDAGYAEFMAAFDDDFGNQTEVEDEGTQDTGEDVGTDTGDNKEQPDGGEDAPAEQDAPPDTETPEGEDAPAAEETFTLKINKEERTCTREEVISLAQKGADYDRIKGRLSEQQATMDLLADFAKESGTDIPGLLDNLRLNLLKKQGLSEDVAKERLAREKLERENAALKASATPEATAEETPKEKAQREIADFQKAFPDVPLTDQLYEKLKSDIVNGGFSMTDAYRRMKDREQADRIKELEAQLAAEKQNNANRAASPGSQKDSGGRRKKDDFDDFMRALE
ncbi:MAG: hypothetical protein IJB11_05565 [Oscillospiraceae bacterium]|nr:hypothetical protein [Oscillospiraceae bacterium]